jgi:DNA-binding XRE family transcriptional regulator
MAAAPFSRDRLRGHRNGTGLTRAQVAAHIGRTEAAYKSYEAGTAEPPARMLAALAELFGVAIDDLYQQRDDPVADYASAVAKHCRPLTDAELDAVAVVLRKINRRRRAATAAEPDSGPDAA